VDETGNDEDEGISFQQIQDLHYRRSNKVRAVNLTVDEIWACLVATKIRFAFPDLALLALGEIFNIASEGTGTGVLPKSRHAVKQLLDEILPIKATYVAFCPTCDLVTKESEHMIVHSRCPSCSVLYTIPLENGGLQFTVFNVVDQLHAYLKNGKLGRLIRKYKPHYKKLVGTREPYATILADNGIILHICVDASPITSRAGVTQLPVLLHIGNIPVASRVHYPLMAAMFCGKGPKPSSELLLEHLRKEMKDMEGVKIRWQDDLKEWYESSISIPVGQTDYTQKCETLQHSQGGYYGCTVCKIPGE
jgi:hypothetical protein